MKKQKNPWEVSCSQRKVFIFPLNRDCFLDRQDTLWAF